MASHSKKALSLPNDFQLTITDNNQTIAQLDGTAFTHLVNTGVLVKTFAKAVLNRANEKHVTIAADQIPSRSSFIPGFEKFQIGVGFCKGENFEYQHAMTLDGKSFSTLRDKGIISDAFCLSVLGTTAAMPNTAAKKTNGDLSKIESDMFIKTLRISVTHS